MGAIDGGDSGSSPGTGGEAGGGQNRRPDLRLAAADSGAIEAAPAKLGREEAKGGREDDGEVNGMVLKGSGCLLI